MSYLLQLHKLKLINTFLKKQFAKVLPSDLNVCFAIGKNFRLFFFQPEEDDLIKIEDNDDYLLHLEEILKNIHKAYYDLFDQMTSEQPKNSSNNPDDKSPDLKNVIPYVKRKVLQGKCNIVFSGVVPTHISLGILIIISKNLAIKIEFTYFFTSFLLNF